MFMLFYNWYFCLIKIQRGMWGLGTLMSKNNLNCLLIFIGIKLHFSLMSPLRYSFKIFIKFLGSYFFIIKTKENNEVSSTNNLASELKLSTKSLMYKRKREVPIQNPEAILQLQKPILTFFHLELLFERD